MKRVLMLAGAALICAGPALAADVTTTEESTTTITREVVPATPRSESTTTITREAVPAAPYSGSTVATEIIAPEPPPPRVEARPAPPRPGMVWQDGHWEWNPATRTYSWMPGEFAAPPQPSATWSPGGWHKRPDGWVWMPGRWS
jgi:WXXGXW repeat (2 copies)